MGILDAPPVSPSIFTRAVNHGIRLRVLTDAERQAITPSTGDVILTSDTHLYYVGDGATAGGVASSTGLTLAQAKRLGIIEPRTRDLLACVRSAGVTGFKGFGVGNSIVAGTGASSSTNSWLFQVAVLLQADTGVGTTSSWAPTNTGVGGVQITVPMGYAADNLGADGMITAGTTRASDSRRYALVMTMRNDVNTSLYVFNERARTMVRGMLQCCDDVIIVAENPQINYTTGAILDAAQWAGITKVMKEVAADYGCTYVDVWQKWAWEAAAGADLRPRMTDGTHPNDVGHSMIAKLVTQAILAPPIQRSAPVRDRSSATTIAGLAMPIAAYTPVAASVGTSSFSGLTSSTTARRRQTGEVSDVAYGLVNGQTARFDIPLPIYRLRPVVVQGSSVPGTVSLDGVSLGTVGTSNGSTLELPLSVTEPATPAPGIVVVTGTHASTAFRLLGVQVDTPEALDQHAIWPGATESGTWGNATFAATGAATGAAVRSSSTVGDYVDITWYGTYLCFAIESGSDRGKLSEVTDGGATTTHDAYTAGTASYLYRCTTAATVGWHTTRLTVATKHASSSGNLVAVGSYKTCIPPDASLGYAAMAAGETMPLHGKWRTAAVDRVLSGSPYISGWSPAATTIALAGTGAALVRLTR